MRRQRFCAGFEIICGAAVCLIVMCGGQSVCGQNSGGSIFARGDGKRDTPPVLHFVPRTGEMLEEAVLTSVRQAMERPPAADVLIPEMASLYRELAVDESLSRSKRAKYQKKLEYYMIDLGLFVIDDFHRQERNRGKVAQAEGRNGDASLGDRLLDDAGDDAAGAEGGTTQSNAQDLIDLITSTIAPDSWDINGGLGTIRYWSLSPALVVRQTGTNVDDLNRLLIGLR